MLGRVFRSVVRDYRRLEIWQQGRDLAIDVYTVTAGFPPDERYGLTGQMRRASVSIVSNIAEGCGRATHRDLLRFLHIASGSSFELEAQLDICAGLDLLEPDHPVIDRCNKLKRSLSAFISRLASDDAR